MTDRELMQQALDALTCSGEDDDPGHRCTHCDDYVDRNGPLRAALRERLAQSEQEPVAWEVGVVNGVVTRRERRRFMGEQELVIDCPRCGHCCPQSKENT